MFACGGITDPSKNVTETFTGTLTPGGTSSAKPFNVTSTGEFTIKLTALSPVSGTAVIGIDLYQDPSNGNCQSLALYQRNSFATLNVQALAGQIFANHYCVVVYDVGALTTATNYTITVAHP